MKLEQETLVTSDGTKIITGTWRTDSGQVTSQTIKSVALKTGKTTLTNVSGGKLVIATATFIRKPGSPRWTPTWPQPALGRLEWDHHGDDGDSLSLASVQMSRFLSAGQQVKHVGITIIVRN